jgi:surfeit locus 1 family protein
VRRIVLFSLCLLVAAVCVGLGTWQLGRLSRRRAANREALAERALPLSGRGDSGELRANRRAKLSGRLDEEREFLLRGRVVQGVPAILVVTPLRRSGTDTAVLVNRGYVPAPDAVDPGSASWSEPGTNSYTGVLLPIPDRGDGAPLQHAGRETWKTLDLSAMRARVPYPIAPVYLVAEPDSAAGAAHTIRGTVYPFRAEPPPLDEGPHLMYAVQWFGIAAAVVAFGIIFVLRDGPRRRMRGLELY